MIVIAVAVRLSLHLMKSAIAFAAVGLLLSCLLATAFAGEWTVTSPSTINFGASTQLTFQSSGKFSVSDSITFTASSSSASMWFLSPEYQFLQDALAFADYAALSCLTADGTIVATLTAASNTITLTAVADVEASVDIKCKVRVIPALLNPLSIFVKGSISYSLTASSDSAQTLSGTFVVPAPAIPDTSASLSATFSQGNEKIFKYYDLSTINLKYSGFPANSILAVNYVGASSDFSTTNIWAPFIAHFAQQVAITTTSNYKCDNGAILFYSSLLKQLFIITGEKTDGTCGLPVSKFPFTLALGQTFSGMGKNIYGDKTFTSSITINLSISGISSTSVAVNCDIGKIDSDFSYVYAFRGDLGASSVSYLVAITSNKSPSLAITDVTNIDSYWYKKTIVMWVKDITKLTQAAQGSDAYTISELSDMNLLATEDGQEYLITEKPLAFLQAAQNINNFMSAQVNRIEASIREQLHSNEDASMDILQFEGLLELIDTPLWGQIASEFKKNGIGIDLMSNIGNKPIKFNGVSNYVCWASYLTQHSTLISTGVPAHTISYRFDNTNGKFANIPHLWLTDDSSAAVTEITDTSLTVQFTLQSFYPIINSFDTSQPYVLEHYIKTNFNNFELRSQAFPSCTAVGSKGKSSVTITPSKYSGINGVDSFAYSYLALKGKIYFNENIVVTCKFDLTSGAKPALSELSNFSLSVDIIEPLDANQYSLISVSGKRSIQIDLSNAASVLEGTWTTLSSTDVSTCNAVVSISGPAITTTAEHDAAVDVLINVLQTIPSKSGEPFAGITRDDLQQEFGATLDYTSQYNIVGPYRGLSLQASIHASSLIFLVKSSFFSSGTSVSSLSVKQSGNWTITAAPVVSASCIKALAFNAMGTAITYAPAYGKVALGGMCFSSAQCADNAQCYEGACTMTQTLSAHTQAAIAQFNSAGTSQSVSDAFYQESSMNSAVSISAQFIVVIVAIIAVFSF